MLGTRSIHSRFDPEGMSAQRKILVVDDERVIADTLATILERHGFDVYVAYSGKWALELARQIEPDFVVSDVMMPDKTGIEVAAVLRIELPHCKVILSSGSAANASLLKLARQFGYEGDILAKPVSPSDLLIKLNTLAS